MPVDVGSEQVGVTAGTRRGNGVNFSVTESCFNKKSVTVTVTVMTSSALPYWKQEIQKFEAGSAVTLTVTEGVS